MIDVHTHILPEMDDGSSSVEESLEMLRAEANAGVDTVVLTSHYYANNEEPERYLERRKESYDKLLDGMYEHGGIEAWPRLILGSEFRYYDGMGSMELLDEFLIEGTNHLLLEMRDRVWSEHVFDDIRSIRKRNIRPILAHINRYPAFDDLRILQSLKEDGVMIQLNTEAFCHFFSRQKAFRLIRSKLVQYIATDCHGAERRPPDMDRAMKILRDRCDDYVISNIISVGRNTVSQSSVYVE